MRVNKILAIAVASSISAICAAEEYYAQDAGNDEGGNDDAGNDDGGNANGAYYNHGAEYYQTNDYYYKNQYASDGIDFWTNYAIMPISCITQNNKDVITFKLYEQGYKQCLNEPMGTYYSNVQTYMSAYLTQEQDNAENQGVDYEEPSAAQYLNCSEYQLQNGNTYYLQLGCNDANKEKLAVNIYTDSQCKKRSVVDGSDDAVFDVSSFKVNFGQCQGCVVWFDKSDADASYWKNHKNQAPLCHAVYEDKQTCNSNCLHSAKVVHLSGWSGSERFVLVCVFAFLGAAVANILQIKYLKKKDELLQTAETEDELNQEVTVDPTFKWGLIGVVSVLGLVAFVTCLLKAKKATWIILFTTSAALFGLLMKLTLETGYKPCGDTTHYDDDSDEEEDGNYSAPTPAAADATTAPTEHTTETDIDHKAEGGVLA